MALIARVLFAVASCALVLAISPASAFDAELQKLLAPSGKLRSGLYPGTPTSILPGARPVGVGFELGAEIATRLGVPYEPVVFSKNAEVTDAVKSGAVDTAFTNASPARARDMDFGPPYLAIELSYLVPRGGAIARIEDADTEGRIIGVTAASSSEAALTRDLKKAKVVSAETIAIALDMLAAGKMDAFATNKATLFEMAEKLPGSKVLEGRWGLEQHAIAIPKGRDAGRPFILEITKNVIASGFIRDAAARAGLKGAVPVE